MQIFPLKIQSQNVMSDCFKKMTVTGHEFHMIFKHYRAIHLVSLTNNEKCQKHTVMAV